MTLEQAQEYLDGLGISVPEFLLQAWLDDLESRKDCLEGHYTASQIIEIFTLFLALKVSAQGGRYVSNQGLSGGLYQGFRYKDDKSLWKGLTNSLKLLDKHMCIIDLIPDDPYSTGRGFIFTVRSGCMKGGGN